MSPTVPDGLAAVGELPGGSGDLAEELADRLAAGNARELKLRGLLRSAHEQLARRDDVIARLTGPPTQWDTQDAEHNALRREVERLQACLEREQANRDRMVNTRVWRMARAWWQFKDALRGR